ncbi:MAG: phosphoenolpyruvate synthase [Candidatus Pacebacteria bacterium]|nr:phosphoenolpyruvate synthase [Candidatus Paceibacterota bacterium]
MKQNTSARNKAFVLWFDEIGKGDVGIVGGKNANLGEMYQNLTSAGAGKGEKIAVPYGFAVTAESYRYFVEKNGLDAKIKGILKGLDTNNIKALEKAGHAVREAIMGATFPPELSGEIEEAYKALALKLKIKTKDLDVAVRSSATAEDLPDASFAGQQESYLNVTGVDEVLLSIKKCMSSLFTNRAISYREHQGYDHFNVLLSVAVQKMARSDRGASGVLFTLDTESGFKDAIIINGSWGLGEYIVKGIVTPDEYVVFKPTLAKGFKSIVGKKMGSKEKKLVYSTGGTEVTKEAITTPSERNRFVLTDEQILQLARWGAIIEEHYKRPMDIEWALDGKTGGLYIVQARPETVESGKSGVVLSEYKLIETGKLLAEGAAVGAKIGQGKVRYIKDASQLSTFKKGEVLVTEITDPDWEPIMKIASAIVTDAGGRTSHAAIVSRELGIPAIVGTGTATKVLKNGMDITVSCSEGEVGKVYAGLLKFKHEKHDLKDFQKPNTPVKMIVADPQLVFSHASLPHSGVGLAREEFIISNFVKIHPNALINYKTLTDKKLKAEIDALTKGYDDKVEYYVEKLKFGIATISAAFYPYEVVLRFSDFKSNEYRGLIGGSIYEPLEENPMMGWRGASRYYDPNFMQAFELECRAVKEVREELGLWNLKVMVPFCRTPEEGRKVVALMEKYGLKRDKKDKKEYKVVVKKGNMKAETVTVKSKLEIYVMAEIPSNILQADEFADIFDSFSIGSNDLTQLTLGLDRDSKLIAHIGNERNGAVQKLITELIRVAHKRGMKVGICGQGPSDFPDFAAFLVGLGIDSISINPDTVLKASLNISAVEKKLKGKK